MAPFFGYWQRLLGVPAGNRTRVAAVREGGNGIGSAAAPRCRRQKILLRTTRQSVLVSDDAAP